MKILAVETATEACSAALYIDGEIKEKYQLAPREHTRLILPMIESLLTEASLSVNNLDALAFGRGPGSFTGVRIATGIIHGIAFGAGLPVVPVSTLAAIAQDCMDNKQVECVFTAMDARMGEIYWAEYRRDKQGYAQLTGQETVGPIDHVSCLTADGYGAGSGWKLYQAQLTQRLRGRVSGCDASLLPRAAKIALLGAVGVERGGAVPVEMAMPVYLRNKVAKKESER